MRRSSRNPPTARIALAALAIVSISWLAFAATARAESYQGSGDTGWTEDNQRDCCDDAVALAQQNSASMCSAAGGEPRVHFSSNRGLCDWDVDGDGDDQTFRCTATAEVDCW